MRRRRYLTRIGAGLSVGVAGFAGCAAPGDDTATEAGTEAGGAEGTPTEGGTETTTAGENQTTDGAGGGQRSAGPVAMITEESEYYFDPIGLFVEQGDEVTWVNESGSHSSTAYTEDNPQSEVRRIPEDAEGWNSDTLSEEGAEFSHTFEVTGTYDYYCIPHKTLGMVGRVVVGEPGGPAEGSQPPDGEVPDSATIVEQGAVSYEDFTG